MHHPVLAKVIKVTVTVVDPASRRSVSFISKVHRCLVMLSHDARTYVRTNPATYARLDSMSDKSPIARQSWRRNVRISVARLDFRSLRSQS